MSSGKALQNTTQVNQPPTTPSLTKTKNMKEKTNIRSPTDSLVSPCSQRIRKRATKDVQSDFQVPEEKENAPSLPQ